MGVCATVVMVLLTVLTAGWALSMDGYDGLVTEHFDGNQFLNREPTPLPTPTRALQMAWNYDAAVWQWRDNTPHSPPPERVTQGLRVTFVNHATVLVQFDGLNVLTDPIWSERCSAVQWAGPGRHHPPGITLDELPPIDVVLVSHNHYDHLDTQTLKQLALRGDPLVLTGLGNGDFIRDLGLRTEGLDWDSAREVGGVQIVGQRTRHFSSRGLFDRNQTLWLGFALVGPTQRVYFGGDTGMGSHFAETGAQFGPFDLALIPIGAFKPRWFMGPIHIDPADAVLAHQQLRARHSLGIHHGTFQLSEEGQDDPALLVREQAAKAGLAPGDFRTLAPGEAWTLGSPKL